MVHFVVNEQEMVMNLVEPPYLDKRILDVVAVNIKLELTADTLCVDSGRYPFRSFIKQGKYGIIHIVVNQHNGFFRFPYQIGHETVSIEHLLIRYKCRGKRYYAVGFPNIAGGFELRSRYFKGCISLKSISVICGGEKKAAVCCLFEGFMDYLSFLMLRTERGFCLPGDGQADCIVLNSVANTARVSGGLDGYGLIYGFLDNDTAGKRAMEELVRKFGSRVRDGTPLYGECKDLNEYLVNRNPVSQAIGFTDK